MSASESHVLAILLEKLEKHLGSRFPLAFYDFNDVGPQGVLYLEHLKSIIMMYGEYSDMTPYIRQLIQAFESGIVSTASIGGKTRNAFTIQRSINVDRAIYNTEKSKGMFDFDLFGKKKEESSIMPGAK